MYSVKEFVSFRVWLFWTWRAALHSICATVRVNNRWISFREKIPIWWSSASWRTLKKIVAVFTHLSMKQKTRCLILAIFFHVTESLGWYKYSRGRIVLSVTRWVLKKYSKYVHHQLILFVCLCFLVARTRNKLCRLSRVIILLKDLLPI